MAEEWLSHRLSHKTDLERGDHDLNPGFSLNPQLRRAAVLVGLVQRPQGLCVLLTQRTNHLEHHPGQICFPGGQVEKSDQDATATALRETTEEIGLSESHIRIVGDLDTYITRTGFTIAPVVGLIQPPLNLCLDAFEVEDVFEMPLSFLLNAENHCKQQREFQGQMLSFYAMPYGDYYIWGATAGILMNLYQVLTDAP